MKAPSPSPAEPVSAGWCSRIAGGLLLLALVGGQAWLVLSLFGPTQPWDHLLNADPVVSGRHPLHLYHGHLGARALRDLGTLCCYDPSFSAGYPKTPVFDGGSRPAELFLLVTGGDYRPASYKVGLALCCCAVPLVLAFAARGAGLGPGTSALAAGLGLLVFWSNPCRTLLDRGDLDLLLASLAAVLSVGMLLRFDRQAGPTAWLGLLAGVATGCLAHPLFFLTLLLAVLLIYYLSVGPRHEFPWHIGLLTAVGLGVAVNLFWLLEWVDFCWVLLPIPNGDRLLTHRTLRSFWDAPLWGGVADRALALFLFAAALSGLVMFNQSKARVAARLLGIGSAGLLVLSLVGIAWEPAGRFGAIALLVPALFFAVLPAAYAWQGAGGWLHRHTGCHVRTTLALSVLASLAIWASWPALTSFAQRCRGPAPLAVGLSAERQTLTATLAQCTTPEARILWEDRPGSASRWTALLPLMTGRSFLGGLDPEATIEYGGSARFAENRLAGRPLQEWADADLKEFCDKYNLGWVVCWTPAAQARFRAWSVAECVTVLSDDGQKGCLFALRRPRSFVLKGQGRWVSADCRHIVLSDVRPDADGKVVLSLHYQAGMEVTPSRVRLEKDLDPRDPIPFVRLRIPDAVTRVTLSWEGP